MHRNHHDIKNLEKIASQIRGKLVEISCNSKTPHLGGSLSCVDILVALYWDVLKINPLDPYHPERDKFILSKGHAATAIFTVLAFKNFFPLEYLDSYASDGSLLEEHPSPNSVPGIELGTGSLGHGLSVGVGMALGSKLNKVKNKIVVLMSDGECNEGSVWEAAMFAPAYMLDNLFVIIDVNGWQATDKSNNVLKLQPLKDKWESFGWEVNEFDGHDMGKLINSLNAIKNNNSFKPYAFITNTIKGKGVSFMEDDNNWHYRIPTTEEVVLANKELNLI
jgi:transketolase